MPHRSLRSRETARVPLFAGLLVLTVALLLGFTYAAVVTQHATGIFIHGQARWMQSHARVVMYLQRYARSGNPASLAGARQAAELPEAYRRARLLLAPGQGNKEAAISAFMEGSLTRPDAERATQFARIFRAIPAARPTLAAWDEGDKQFDTLMAVGARLRDAHARGDSAAIVRLVDRIDQADRELLRLEQVFAEGMAETARLLPPLVIAVGTLLGVLLVAGSVFTFWRVARAADRANRENVEYFRRLHALMESVPDMISWVDRDRRFTYVNPAFERMTGASRERLIGHRPDELMPVLDADTPALEVWNAALDRAFTGIDGESHVVEVVDPQGQTHSLQYRLAGQRNEDGAVETVMAIARDITALRASEAALRERDMQLRHAQKLEAVGRLAGGVAHEFNNILTAITANLELALLDLPPHGETRRDLQAALAAARRAAGLTRQLLVFGRRDPVELRPVNLDRLIAELEPMLERLAGDAVHVAFATDAAHSTIMADPGQLQQVVFNLVSNARDAMLDGGTIHVTVGQLTGEEIQARKGLVIGDGSRVAAMEPEQVWTTLAVRDEGTGMSAEVRERLFEPFFTTKPAGAGSGLGLAVVEGIVTQLGGIICVESEPGGGTTMTIAFPRVDAAERASPAPGADRDTVLAGDMPTAAGGRGELVLLVEDEAPVRMAARRMLEQAGYRVAEAQHADDALLQWERQRADIVVTDFMMPGLTGAELLARLRAMKPALPAVIVSGYTGGGTIDEAALGTNTSLLQKPFTRAQLLQAVRQRLNGGGR